MWKALWQKWTIEKPAALGDWLWDVFVVQFAGLLDRLTLRQVAVYIPLVILFFAYAHDVPVSPALIFLGDLIAYIDIFAVLVLIGILSRVATVVFIAREAISRVAKLTASVMAQARRLDVRHRRERGAKGRKWLSGRADNDDDQPVVLGTFAWA
jgi:hypothetical protein